MQRVRIKFNDEGEQKLIPGVSKPKKPPTQAQIEMAKIMAECYSVKKAKKGILVVKSGGPRDTEAPPTSTPPQSPLARQNNHHSAVETDEEQEEENKHPPTQQHYYPPSSPEAPSFYRGKPPELLSRRYPV